ncbi:cellulose synthase operon protein YhjQ/BcsQ [Sphingomonas sp.]|uniref:cellulose synthase operon protein YhjQ/BcsQ n=1 Tax=Sphingomonas sp. TaxID=28214 RepID=UPI003B3BA85C
MTLIISHSPKGGVGTTFLSAYLAAQFAERGLDVTLIDFTFQDDMKLYFGIQPGQELSTLGDRHAEPLLAAGVELLQGYQAAQDPAIRRDLQSGRAFSDSNRLYIADIPSGDRDLKAILMPHATLHICALLPRAPSLAALTKVDQDHPAIGLEKTVFIMNQVDDRQRLSGDSHAFVRAMFGEQLIGSVRRDEALNETLAMFEPLTKYAPTSVLIPDLAVLADAVLVRCGLATEQDDTLRAGA